MKNMNRSPKFLVSQTWDIQIQTSSLVESIAEVEEMDYEESREVPKIHGPRQSWRPARPLWYVYNLLLNR